jgi:hypothetical protein
MVLIASIDLVHTIGLIFIGTVLNIGQTGHLIIHFNLVIMDGIDLLTGDTHNIVGIMIPGITKVNVAYHTGRRGSSNIQSKIVANSTNRTRIVTNVDIEELAVKLRNKLPNKNIRIYKNPNNPNINNNSKPRVYVRPNNNNTMRTNTRLVTSKPVINPIIRNKKNN